MPTTLEEVVDRLLDLLLWVTATLGLVVVAGTMNRWVQKGWHPQHAVHLGVYLVLLAGLLAGRRIPRGVRVGVFLVPLWVNGGANLVWHGLAGTGMLFFAVVCIVAVVLSGLRVAVAFFSASLLALVLVAVSVWQGFIAVENDVDQRLRTGTEWLAQGAAFLGLVAGCLVTLNAIHTVLRKSTERLQQRTAELEHEIAERKRVGEQLREREQRYRILADNSRDVVFTQDMDLNITYVSPAAAAMFGYPLEEGTRLELSQLMTEESLQAAMKSFREYAERARSEDVVVPLMEYEYLRADGSTFWGELHGAFTRDQDGRLTGFQGILRDISDRKRAEAERVELETQLHQTERLRAIGRLAGGIAHDFNNQLAGITGYAELLRAKKREDATVQDHTEKILVPARRAADLTSKLLAFARRGNYRAEPVDLHAIVREAISILERSIAKNITILERLEADRCLVFGDATLLQSAVLNVALNARDAMPDGGKIEFSTELVGWSDDLTDRDAAGLRQPSASRGERILLRVRDTGEGMDEATLRRVFEPFFTTKPVGQGTGMGLAAVHGTVHSHGGTVEVQSEPGRGTTLTLALPLLDESFLGRGEGNAEGIVGGKGHVFVIDDEPMMRNIAAGLLEHVGYRVTTSGRPRAALDLYAVQYRSIDLVLLDMVLPELSGAEVFHALRATNPDARVLLFSGYSPEGEARDLIRQGAVGFVQKPFTLAELSERVAEALKTEHPQP